MGHALLFLQPNEMQYVDVLSKDYGLVNIVPLALREGILGGLGTDADGIDGGSKRLDAALRRCGSLQKVLEYLVEGMRHREFFEGSDF